MANAKKCDRCDGLYEENHEDKRVDNEGNLDGYIVCIRVNDTWSRQNWLDICDKCLVKLVKKWLEST